MNTSEENPSWIYGPRFIGGLLAKQISIRISTKEVRIRIVLAPLICAAGGCFLSVYQYPLLFAMAIALANFQKRLGVMNLILFILNLALSYVVFYTGLLLLGGLGNFVKEVLDLPVDSAHWIDGFTIFTMTPFFLLRIYALLFNYDMDRMNKRRIFFTLVALNLVFYTCILLRVEVFEAWEHNYLNEVPYYFWLVACCFSLQLMVYSKQLERETS